MSTVLLVEDEAPAAQALSSELKKEGFDVLLAADGEQGLSIALEKHPDVILADLKLPKMMGMDMIREIRKDEWGKKAEIIILTNMSDVAMVEEAMSHDTFFYIVKGDTSMADVVAKVRSRIKS